MKEEIVRYKKLSPVVMILSLILFYIVFLLLFSVFEWIIGIRLHLLIKQFIFLYMFSMFIIYKNYHYYEYKIIKGHLNVKEFLGKKEKQVIIIPFDHIVSMNNEQQNKDKFYNKRHRFTKKYYKKATKTFIEFDDYTDISLLEIQGSKELISIIGKNI